MDTFKKIITTMLPKSLGNALTRISGWIKGPRSNLADTILTIVVIAVVGILIFALALPFQSGTTFGF